MQPILDFIKYLFDLFVDSGLAEKTADAFARIISFDGWELDELMWWLTDAIVAIRT